MSRAEDIATPSPPVVIDGVGRLDLPGLLPLVLVAATWEFLLLRVIGLAARNVRGSELAGVLGTLSQVGAFVEYFAYILSVLLVVSSVVTLLRRPTFGPIPHRVTIAGFALTLVTVAAVSVVTPVSPDTGLLAHAAAVLMSTLIILGLSWHPVDRRLLIGGALLLLPTLLRFYASCSLSIPLLRTNSAVPLHAFRAGEVAAVLAALAAPWLLAGLKPRDLLRRPPLVAIGLASMPMLALAAALTFHGPRVRELCLLSLGFELILPLASLIYPLALFCFFLTVSILVLPGIGAPRILPEQRVGYGLALLFVAGLDGLRGTVLGLGAEIGDVPELVGFLLEGHWEHLNPGHQALVGPPLRDMYQLIVLGLAYLLIARGVAGQAHEPPITEDTPATTAAIDDDERDPA